MPKKNHQNSPNPPSDTEEKHPVVEEVAGLALDVDAIRKEIRAFFDSLDENGKTLGSHTCGVYVFYDYDGEPIYVGQTIEGLSARVGRHLTNQRTDAVAMNVLDPFEVAEIRVWPFDVGEMTKDELRVLIDRAEYTVYKTVLAESKLGAVLNEKPPKKLPEIKLPKSYRKRIIPDNLYPIRKHPDTRIARRASTIANLARVISERKVSKGLRITLQTQARRLERLATERLKDFQKVETEESEGVETEESEGED